MTEDDEKTRATQHLLAVSWPGFWRDRCRFGPGEVERRTMDDLLARQQDLMGVREFLDPLKDNPLDEMLYGEQMRLRDRIEQLEHALERGAVSGLSGESFTMEVKVAPGEGRWVTRYVFRYHTRDNTLGKLVEEVAEFPTAMEAKLFMDRHTFMTKLENLT